MKKGFKKNRKLFPRFSEKGYGQGFLKIRFLFLIFLSVLFIEFILLAQFFQIIPTTRFLASIFPNVLVDLTNQNREEFGLRNLKQSPLLQKAAQLKAEDMASKGYFSHTSPEGITPWHWFDLVGYDFVYAGENLAVNFLDSYDINRAWMSSSKHKKNIINANFSEIGIGVASGYYKGRESIFVAQFFGTPKSIFGLSGALPEPVKGQEEGKTSVLKDDLLVLGKESILGSETEEQTQEKEDFNSAKNSAQEQKPFEEPFLEEESFIYMTKEKEIIYSDDDEGEREAVRYSSFLARIISSPKRTVSFLLFSLLLIVITALVLKIIVKVKTRLPVLIIDGLMVLAVIILACLFNNHIFSLIGQIY